MAELADAHGLGPCEETLGGSSPLRPTTFRSLKSNNHTELLCCYRPDSSIFDCPTLLVSPFRLILIGLKLVEWLLFSLQKLDRILYEQGR